MGNKKALRDLLERLFADRPEERERMLRAMEDERFSCHDWMEREGYTQQDRLTVLKFSGDVLQLTVERTKKPVPKWTAKDWEDYEVFQWQCTDIFREMLKGYFTAEQINEIADAWEHERYVHHSISEGHGRMHHCKFCSERTH